jgi:hypothetical protein
MTALETHEGKVIQLSEDQELALSRVWDALQAGKEAVLAGAAGTGKTTIMRSVIDKWQSVRRGSVILLAPTGRAAQQLSKATRRTAHTIHSAIFKHVEELEVRPDGEGDEKRQSFLHFDDPNPPFGCTERTLVIVDEASMVNSELAAIVRRQVLVIAGAALLWVGDHEQLPPPEGVWGVDLQNATARLDKVHRQALDSPILDLATCFREGRAKDFTRWGDEVDAIQGATIQDAVEWLENERQAEAALLSFTPTAMRSELRRTRVLLTWRNAVRTEVNRVTRARRGYDPDRIHCGETLLCKFNHYPTGLMNGEAFVIDHVEPCHDLSCCIGATVVWVREHVDIEYRTNKNGKRVQLNEGRRFLVIPALFDRPTEGESDRSAYRACWRPLWAKTTAVKEGEETAPELMRRLGWGWDQLQYWRTTVKRHAVQCTFGYCSTVHSAQGSQYKDVGFISCPVYRKAGRPGDKLLSPDDKRRLIYTAVTRAQERFRAFIV